MRLGFAVSMRSAFILSVIMAAGLCDCAPTASGRDISSGDVCVSDEFGVHCEDLKGNVHSGQKPKLAADN